jgi:hypothetical protein
MHNQQTDSFWLRPSEGFNVIYFLAEVHAACFTPLLRSGFGRDGLGMAGAFAFVAIGLWAAFAQSYAILAYLWVWLAFVIYRRIETWRLAAKGWRIHSRWQGDPWTASWLIKNDEKARRLELCVVLFAAIAAAPFDEGLASFLLAGMVSLAVVEGVRQQILYRRRIERENAVIEAESYMDY